MDIDFSSRLPYFVAKRVKKALTARPYIDHKRCTLCGACVAVCPPAIMKKNARIDIDYEACIRCFCCLEVCPQNAISVKEGWLRRFLI
ncbi:MAG: 4Fe-4S binding protein [Deltaproteobacteria bacterium]|nr:4Fe-4S binding protein [Deltaproteobacteria bacterium]